jgi:hypothetical protein
MINLEADRAALAARIEADPTMMRGCRWLAAVESYNQARDNYSRNDWAQTFLDGLQPIPDTATGVAEVLFDLFFDGLDLENEEEDEDIKEEYDDQLAELLEKVDEYVAANPPSKPQTDD